MVNLPQLLIDVIDQITANETAFKESCRGFERLLLLEVIREADLVGYARAFDPGRQIPGAPGHLDLVWTGLAHAFDLLGPTAMAGPGMMWDRSVPERTAWAMGFIRRCGLVTLLRRYAQLVRRDLATVEVVSANQLRFRIHGQDLEALDRDAIQWHSKRVQFQQRPILEAFHQRYGEAIAAELRARAQSDPLFGIRYSSSRELEECFEFEAELRAATLPGSDCLPNSARLGPLTFGEYRRVVVAGIARCFKHAAFVTTLLAKDPSVPSTALTIHAEERTLKKEWGGLLDLDDATAAVLLDVLSVTPDDLPEIRRTLDCPQALLVRAGDTFWHEPVFGGLNNPFGWITAKLRRRFRPDWDRAVGARETQFRSDLQVAFPEPRFWFAPTTVKLRRGGNIDTDIDAVLIDRQCGTMGVFQLKWQDTFENSLAERESRFTNLSKEGNNWIAKLAELSSGLSPRETASRLGAPPSLAGEVQAIRIFILTKNAARFSGPERQNQSAAWLSWYELLRRRDRAVRQPDILSTVWSGARRARARSPESAKSSFVVDGFCVEVVHALEP
ncbi:hypothetical protein [Ancylobacter sp. SL191]|uniref:hypothetical protein n=1 Tax=Ancylobacter sp. SL191 TaxID=2995166 RepID=UPI00226D568F|nr:hypothetical protein [Ancylobacter sp. SL191]WAC28783.1 hypothetical protein OU996_07000 [Ancylobacter sp. SL191]